MKRASSLYQPVSLCVVQLAPAAAACSLLCENPFPQRVASHICPKQVKKATSTWPSSHRAPEVAHVAYEPRLVRVVVHVWRQRRWCWSWEMSYQPSRRCLIARDRLP